MQYVRPKNDEEIMIIPVFFLSPMFAILIELVVSSQMDKSNHYILCGRRSLNERFVKRSAAFPCID